MSSEKKCIVISIGSRSTIVGFSDRELPTCILPSTYMQNKNNLNEYIFDKYEMLQISSSRNNTASKNDYEVFTLVNENGIPYNWTALEKQWDYIFKQKLQCDPKEYPMVISIPMISKTIQLRILMEKYMELAFEKFDVPIIQFLLEPLATTLSMGKKNALVIDIGFNGCKITPVIDGIVVKNGVTKNKYGGAFLDYVISKFLDQKVRNSNENINTNLEPKEKTPIEIWWESNTCIEDFKMSMLQVCDKDLQDLERYYREQEQMYLKQQEQMKQLGGTGIVTGTVPAFNSNIINMTNNPLTQNKNYLYKPLNKTLRLTQKEILSISEYLFKPNLFSETFPQDDGLSEIVSKCVKKTAATICNSTNNNTDGDNTNTDKNGEISSNNHKNVGVNPNNTMIRTIGSSLIIPPKPTSDGTNSNRNSGLNRFDNNTNFSDGFPSSIQIGNSGNSLTTTPEHIYSSLLTNVIITGSTSLINGMEQRIIQELSIRFPQYKLITFANQYTMDRQLQGWISCCTMANLPTWELGRWYSQEEWISAQNSSNTNEESVRT